MRQTEKLCVTFPIGLRARAHANGINVSAVAAKAVARIVQTIEIETPANSRQTITGAAATNTGRAT